MSFGSGWQLGGLNLDLALGGLLRARGRTVGGSGSASSGLIEQIALIEFVPEIVVEQPWGHGITNGSSQSPGAATVGGNTSLGFTIRNIGNVHLIGVAITIDGPDAEMFTLTTEPATFMEPLGGYGNFIVKFSPTSAGVKTATLHIASNDADENPFDIILTARGQTAPIAGSVDPTFAPEFAAGYVQATAVQPDGKIVVGGNFNVVNGELRINLARLNADGTVESTDTFNPGTGANGALGGVTLQGDGKILIVGSLIAVNEQPRTLIARLANDTAIQTLTVSNRTRIVWLRSGTAPEVEQVTFEVSTNGGASWSVSGVGTRVAGGWECTGLNLPLSGMIRARGRTIGATFSGSSSLVEQTVAFDFSPRALQQNILADLVAFRVTVTSRTDGRKLDLAIKHLTHALAPKLWADDTHLSRKLGHRAFHETKLTAWILCRLIKSTKSLSDTVLQGFIDRIFEAERGLATVAIDDAISAGASSRRIAQAQNYLARGDARATVEKCHRGIHDYGLAWCARVKLRPDPVASGKMTPNAPFGAGGSSSVLSSNGSKVAERSRRSRRGLRLSTPSSINR